MDGPTTARKTRKATRRGADAAEAARAVDAARASPLFVASLEKGMRVLRAFDEEHSAMRLADIAAVAGLDRSAAQRFVHSLKTLGFIRQDARTRLYSLSPRVLELAYGYLRSDPLVRAAMPFLHELGRRSEESVNLSEMAGPEIIFIARVPGRHSLTVDILLGSRYPAFSTAPGRAMLAFMPRAQAEELLAQSELVSFTGQTITDRGRLLELLDETREQGWCLAHEEIYLGELSLAAPVLDRQGEATAAINISVPAARWDIKRAVRDLVPALSSAAGALSRTVSGDARGGAAAIAPVAGRGGRRQR
ncbi:MAG: helix-turn-helix domain-containing protein [Planctomycetes bacterium]|nr:helix-turn-helix domain-containing protein [Planctomycetota bacterium]